METEASVRMVGGKALVAVLQRAAKVAGRHGILHVSATGHGLAIYAAGGCRWIIPPLHNGEQCRGAGGPLGAVMAADIVKAAKDAAGVCGEVAVSACVVRSETQGLDPLAVSGGGWTFNVHRLGGYDAPDATVYDGDREHTFYTIAGLGRADWAWLAGAVAPPGNGRPALSGAWWGEIPGGIGALCAANGAMLNARHVPDAHAPGPDVPSVARWLPAEVLTEAAARKDGACVVVGKPGNDADGVLYTVTGPDKDGTWVRTCVLDDSGSLPIDNVRRIFPDQPPSHVLTVNAAELEDMAAPMSKARGVRVMPSGGAVYLSAFNSGDEPAIESPGFGYLETVGDPSDGPLTVVDAKLVMAAIGAKAARAADLSVNVNIRKASGGVLPLVIEHVCQCRTSLVMPMYMAR